ncbi:transposase [Sneathiella sp.]|uniref:IS66-like element accessory protein TnpA n=1 Tax=Sneathiella sp. TaxID=1964365 RepID=UPI00260367E0|nr:transposase [Sneathiella sp.]MDF2369070.1 transposase [Sneathiella sp.]
MARLSSEKRAELEGFWRSHHEGWECSALNQREYCEAHGLPLKRFGNWRAMFKTETAAVQGKLLYRRGGRPGHMAGHMSDKEIAPTSTGYVPSVKSMPEARRNFRRADKKRIVAEAMAPGASVSGIARRYGIDSPLLFRWKREFAPPAPEPVFLPATVSDGPDQTGATSLPARAQVAGPVIVERSPQEIEVELVGGRRLRFTRDVEAGMVRAMIALLERLAS